MKRREFLKGSALAAVAAPMLAGAAENGPGAQLKGGVYTRQLATAYDVDVFVAGGGPAGVAAALAAVRAGKSVFLAETSGAFGGAATTAYVPAFATFSDGVRDVVGGIGMEIRRQVSRNVPLSIYWTPIDMEELKRVYDRLMSESGAKFSFFTTVCDAVVREGRVEQVVVATKRGLLAVRARVFVDCTGDADLCAFAGGKYEMGDATGKVMPSTLCSQWCDIDFSQKNPWAQSLLPKAIADGVFSVPDLHLPGFFKATDGSSLGGANIGHVFGMDPTDERSLTAGMMDARKRLPEYERFYKEYLKGYEKMRLASTAPYMGVRESRRVVCDYMLGVRDFLARASFEDEIGRYCYPVDIHPSKPGDAEAMKAFRKEYEHDLKYKKGESYGIPYRSLIAKSFSNVLVAGRCMGTDQKMQASVRVMPGCFITGQAAGTAAAMAAANGDVRSVRGADLRAKLAAAGAYVPEKG